MGRTIKLGMRTSFMALAASACFPAFAQNAQPVEGAAEAGQEQSQTNPDEAVIVVTGTRASIGNSIDAKRDSDAIIDVLSADDANRFPDQNVAEGLSRIPGISFQRDNDTSDGEFISIRGLDAQYNTVLNDGIRVGTADTFRRSALNVITGSGISSIEVIKAPLAEHASEGIGGVVNIRTRGALERREGGFIGAELSSNSFADNDGFRIDGGFVFHVTDRLGIHVDASYRRRFFQNYQINPATTEPEIMFPQTFTAADGSPLVLDDADDIEDILDLVPTNFLDISQFNAEQVDYEFADIRDDTFNVSGTIEWELSDSTNLLLGGRYNRGNRKETISTIEFDADPDDFVDGSLVPGGTPGQLIRSFRDPEITFEGQLEDELEIQQSYFIRGETKLDNWTFDYVVGWSKATRNDPILSIDFFHEFEDIPGSPGTNTAAERSLSFAPFNLNGEFVAPNPFNLGVFQTGLNPFCTQTNGELCAEIIDFDEELEDLNSNERWSARFDVTREFDGDFLDYIKAGFQYEDSKSVESIITISDTDDFLGEGGAYRSNVDTFPDNEARPGELGVVTDQIQSFDDIGNPYADIGFNGIPLFSREGLLNIRNTYRNGFLASGETPLLSEFIRADEEFFTGYAQAKFNLGKDVWVVGGVRVEQYNAQFESPSLFEGDIFVDPTPLVPNSADTITLSPTNVVQSFNETDNFEVLPRILANWNINDRARVRASYSTSIARPSFDLLLGNFDGSLDIEITEGVTAAAATQADIRAVEADFRFGNPNLKNSYSHNFDVSFEYYFDRQNAFTIGAFYKSIDSFVFSSFVGDAASNLRDDVGVGQSIAEIIAGANFTTEGQALVDQLGGIEAILNLPGASVSISQPANGNRAEVYGVEIGAWHSFDYLPGFLKNFGVIANVTFQDTKAELTLGALQPNDILVLTGERAAGDELVENFQFFNSPNFIGNAVLYYDSRDFEANLSYRFSGTQLEEIELFGISQFQQGRGFLDFNMQYTLRKLGPLRRVTLEFDASDILDTGRKFSVFETRGKSEAFSDLATFNGRTFTIGARVSF